MSQRKVGKRPELAAPYGGEPFLIGVDMATGRDIGVTASVRFPSPGPRPQYLKPPLTGDTQKMVDDIYAAFAEAFYWPAKRPVSILPENQAIADGEPENP